MSILQQSPHNPTWMALIHPQIFQFMQYVSKNLLDYSKHKTNDGYNCHIHTLHFFSYCCCLLLLPTIIIT